MKVEHFEYKLAGMRKPDSYIVYPREKGSRTLRVQGSRSMMLFDQDTRRGVLNWKGAHTKYGVHLMVSADGAQFDFEFPKEFVALAVEFCPSSGDEVGPGMRLA